MFGCKWLCLLVVVVGVGEIRCQKFVFPTVSLNAYEPSGLQVSIPASPGIQMFGFHAKVNQEISGIELGEIATDIRKADADGYFRYFDPSITLKVGDRINYWVFVQNKNLGYRKDKLSWTVSELKKRNPDCVTSSTRSPGIDRICSGNYILEDDFEQLDPLKWKVEQYIAGHPDYEFVVYSDERLQISNSKLEIKPSVVDRETAYGPSLDIGDRCTKTGSQCSMRKFYINAPTRSARLTSKLTFSYGDVEIRARLPQGDWIFPELYLEEDEPGNNNQTRILIAYARGNRQLVGNAGDDVGGSLLFGGPVVVNSEPERSKYLSSYKHPSGPLSDDFHTYRLKWTPDLMEFYVDGNNYGFIKNSRIKSEKFSGSTPKQFRLVIGVGVGGMNDFPDGYKSGNTVKPWVNSAAPMVKEFYEGRNDWQTTWGDKSRLEVEYVKIKAL